MDRIIAIVLCLFVILLVPFAGISAWTGYAGAAYRDTINSTVTYSCTVSADGPVSNLTLFVPVPADRAGNSPVVTAYGSGDVTGIPDGWTATLYDTGKATLIKITGSQFRSGTVTLAMERSGPTPIETRDPAGAGMMFRPVQDPEATTCPAGTVGSRAQCSSFTTPLYADYSAAPGTTITITSAVDGTNTWDVFGRGSSGFRAAVRATMQGEHHGWTDASGELIAGTGDEIPALIS